MKICLLAAGAGGMYCGSCLRDNALAAALRRAGHDVTLLPLYTPLKTDQSSQADPRVFFGGLNIYLQHASALFRKTPRLIDWLFDRPLLLKLAARFGAQSTPDKLGPLTLSIIQGDEGPTAKELHRLTAFLRDTLKPQIITLPNLMFIGLARALRQETGAPVICELTGEDIFLDALTEPYRTQARDMIRHRVWDVSRFVSTSAYYAQRMADYLAVSPSRIETIPPGLSPEYFTPPAPRPPSTGQTIGYLARICPEKGLDRLLDAFLRLRKNPRLPDLRLKYAGYLGPAHQPFHTALRQRIDRENLAQSITYAGQLDLPGKLAFLDSLDLFSVPTAYPEAKGLSILEALARGVPVVQPNHGAFPELINATSAGLLVRPNDPQDLADALADLLLDPNKRHRLSSSARQSLPAMFTDTQMAAKMLKLYENVLHGL